MAHLAGGRPGSSIYLWRLVAVSVWRGGIRPRSPLPFAAAPLERGGGAHLPASVPCLPPGRSPTLRGAVVRSCVPCCASSPFLLALPWPPGPPLSRPPPAWRSRVGGAVPPPWLRGAGWSGGGCCGVGCAGLWACVRVREGDEGVGSWPGAVASLSPLVRRGGRCLEAFVPWGVPCLYVVPLCFNMCCNSAGEVSCNMSSLCIRLLLLAGGSLQPK
jgi:hypothetical protein